MSDDDLLDVYEACRVIGGSGRPIHPATLYRGVKDGRYSKPIQISRQAVRWKRSELLRDTARMTAERDQNAA